MAQETIKIKAFNNAEIITFNIVGQIKEADNISLNPSEFNLVYKSVVKTIQQLEKNNLLTESAEDILNG
jgi:hypothetical protein